MNTTNKNNDRKNFVEEKLTNHKLALLLSMAVSFALNLLLVILLAIDGISFGYILFPMLICVFDIAFFAISLFTNFKFSYSLLYTSLYIALFAISSIVFALILVNFGKDTAITYIALAMWAAVVVLTMIAVIFGVSRAGKPRGAIRALVSLVVLCAAVGTYGYYAMQSGFFGQGNENSTRPVTFVYDSENKYYVATGTIDGKGKNIIIPDTFNEIKVGAIDCAIFAEANIKTVTINAQDIVLKNTEALVGVTSDFSVLTGKNEISELTSQIYTLASQSENNRESLISLAKKCRPADLSSNEVYISFAYDAQSVMNAEGEYLPVWIADKNTVFNVNYATGIGYAENSNANDESLLAALYNSDAAGGGYILAPMKDSDGNPIGGVAISDSIDNVAVSFDKIYRIKVSADNDTRYEVENAFRYLDDSSANTKYRFVTANTSAALLSQINQRSGFDISWKYSLGNDTAKLELSALPTLLASISEESVVIHPEWTLNPPTINECKTTENKLSYTYGDSTKLLANATAPNPHLSLSYSWTFNGIEIANQDSFDITKIKMNEGGVYRITVTAYSNTVTSLSSSSSKAVVLSVAKKQLPITWNGIDGTESFSRIYNAESSAIDITYSTDAVVYDTDEITYALSITKMKNATSYSPTVTLTGDCAQKYFVSEAQKKGNYTIQKKDVELKWTVGNYTYTADDIAPAVAIVSGICLDDDLSVVSTANKVPGNYTSMATLTGVHADNYSIKESQLHKDYTILPATLTIDWSETTTTYTAKEQQPTATPIGLQGGESVSVLGLSVTKKKLAGTHTCEVTIKNTNYVIAQEDKTHEFIITPAPLTLTFTNTVNTYTSKLLTPTVTPSGLCTGDTVTGLNLSVTGATNVGTYTVTASITNTNYVLTNPTIDNFVIEKAKITVIWPSSKNLVYNGSEQYLPVSSTSGIYPSDISKVSVATDVAVSSHKDYNASAYTAYAVLTDPTGNYELNVSSATQSFYIVKKALTINWSNTSFTYDGASHNPNAVINSGIISTDSVNLSLSESRTNAGSYTATATLDNSNYSLTNSSCSFNIAKKAITILWTDLEFVYNKTPYSPSASVNSPIVPGDSVYISVSGAQSNAGTHTATASTQNANYSITNNKQSFTIAPKSINVVWSDTNLTYNATTQTPTASAGLSEGVISGDQVRINVTGGKKDAGTEYTATAASSNPNYVIENKTSIFNIAPLVVNVSFANISRTYTGGYLKPTATLIDKPSSDSVTVTVSIDGNTSGAVNAGSYVAIASTTNANYILNEETASTSFTISPKQLTINWSNLSQTYSGAPLKPTVTFSGVSGSDNVTPVITVDGSTAGKTNAGSYTAAVSISDSNYVLSSNTTKQFTIEKRTLNISWSGLTQTYTGKALKPTATFTGAVNGDTVTLTIKIDGSTSGKVNVGSYTVTVTVSNPNYQIAASDATKTFTIKSK